MIVISPLDAVSFEDKGNLTSFLIGENTVGNFYTLTSSKLLPNST